MVRRKHWDIYSRARAGNEIYILISRGRSFARSPSRSILDNGRFVECVHVALLRVGEGGAIGVRFRIESGRE